MSGNSFAPIGQNCMAPIGQDGVARMTPIGQDGVARISRRRKDSRQETGQGEDPGRIVSVHQLVYRCPEANCIGQDVCGHLLASNILASTQRSKELLASTQRSKEPLASTQRPRELLQPRGSSVDRISPQGVGAASGLMQEESPWRMGQETVAQGREKMVARGREVSARRNDSLRPEGIFSVEEMAQRKTFASRCSNRRASTASQFEHLSQYHAKPGPQWAPRENVDISKTCSYKDCVKDVEEPKLKTIANRTESYTGLKGVPYEGNEIHKLSNISKNCDYTECARETTTKTNTIYPNLSTVPDQEKTTYGNTSNQLSPTPAWRSPWLRDNLSPEGDFVQRPQNLWTPGERATRTRCRGCPDNVRFEGSFGHHKVQATERQWTDMVRYPDNIRLEKDFRQRATGHPENGKWKMENARSKYPDKTISTGKVGQEDSQWGPGGQATRQCTPGGQAARLRQGDNLRLEGDFSRREVRKWLPAQERAIVMN